MRCNSKKLTPLLRMFVEVSSLRITRQSGETIPGPSSLGNCRQHRDNDGSDIAMVTGHATPGAGAGHNHHCLLPSLFVPSQNAMQFSESSISSHNMLTELSHNATCKSLPLGICRIPKAVFTKKRSMRSLKVIKTIAAAE